MPQPNLRRKLVIVGDGASGKTSLLCVFAEGEFPTQYEPTVFENYVAEIRLDGKPIQLALWDTAGQEEYERLRPLSYASAHVVLIAFPLDSPDGLENAQYKWAEEVRRICGSHIPVLLIGCKSDLRDKASRQQQQQPPSQQQYYQQPQRPAFVRTEDAMEVAEAIGARHYLECSALRNEGVDAVFEAATRASMLVRSSGAPRAGSSRNGEKRGSKSRRRSSESDAAGGCKCAVL